MYIKRKHLIYILVFHFSQQFIRFRNQVLHPTACLANYDFIFVAVSCNEKDSSCAVHVPCRKTPKYYTYRLFSEYSHFSVVKYQNVIQVPIFGLRRFLSHTEIIAHSTMKNTLDILMGIKITQELLRTPIMTCLRYSFSN